MFRRAFDIEKAPVMSIIRAEIFLNLFPGSTYDHTSIHINVAVVVTSFVDPENSTKTVQVKRLKAFHRFVETSLLLKRFYFCQYSSPILSSFLGSTTTASFCCKHKNNVTRGTIIVSF